MKKIIYSIICIVIIGLIALLFILDLNKGDKKNNDLEKIRVAEVAHTVFYAPQYAAISQGFFEEEGLDIELILTPGADKVTAAVLSGDVEIGFSGSEACIYVYNVFYNLNNMVLCVAGNATVEQVVKIADKMLKKADKHKITNYFEDEPYEIVKDYVEQSFPVSMPLFNLGYKERADKMLNEKELAQTEILLSMLASDTSALYRNLMDAQLINSSFSYELFEGPGYCSVIFGGESRYPQKAAEMIKAYISEVKKNGLSREEFEIAQKAVYGDAVSSLNSVSSISNMIADYHFNGNELFSYIDAIANVTFDDVTTRLSQMLDNNNCTLSVVKQAADEVK